MSPKKDPEAEAETPKYEVGGPIDANVGRGDQTAHVTLRSEEGNAIAAAEEEKKVQQNREKTVAEARRESGLGADGALKPDFEGTMPKLLKDGTLAVVGMQTLKEEAAAKDGETVEKQERDAGLVVGQSLTPQAVEAEKLEEELKASEEDADEVEETEEDDGNMTVAELKEALDGAEIAYPSNARKADLLKLYNDNFE